MPARLSRSRAARPALLVASLALAATALIGGTGAADPDSAPSVAGPECIGAPDNHRVRGGGNSAADPNTVTPARQQALERRLDARASARGLARRSSSARLPQVTVDVRWHVITNSDGDGQVGAEQLQRQIDVLNAGYGGRSTRRSATTLFRFRTASVDTTANDDWYSWSDPDVDPDDDAEAKTALHRGGMDNLNVYLTALEDGLLGYATFPDESPVSRDGVVVLNESLPGGTAEPYNLGDTLTHEVGHWLGLYHTFEGGCSYPGDEVADTPYQDDGDNIFECDESDDTCRQPGRDPVHNFMSYGDDECLDRFTAGQAIRMGLFWYAFRASPRALP